MFMNKGFKMVNDLRNKDLPMLMLDHVKKDPDLTAEIGFYFEKNETTMNFINHKLLTSS